LVGCENVGVSEGHPVVPPDVSGWGDARDLQQLLESFGRAFDSDAREAAVRKNHAGEDFAADFETQIIAPWHIFGCIRKGETEFADPFDVWHGKIIAERANANRSRFGKNRSTGRDKIALGFGIPREAMNPLLSYTNQITMVGRFFRVST
jgi:hypothetical protein